MKIALTAQWDWAFWEVARLTVPIMQEYCLYFGYSFHSIFFNTKDVIESRSRVIAGLLPKYDAVVHVDADCLLTNLKTPVEEIVDFNAQWHVAASGDGANINDGVCIWRKSETVEGFLNKHIQGKYGEVILQDAVAKEPLLNVVNPPPSAINACIPEEYFPAMPEHTRWNAGDFCLHLLAMNNARRIELLHKHIPLIQR